MIFNRRSFLVAAMNIYGLACGDDLKGATIRDIIEDQIRKHVRPSYGPAADECFTWRDLEAFKSSQTPQRIVASLRGSAPFLAAVDEIRSMQSQERGIYLRKCRLPLRKTWAELGEISPRGTTVAGQLTERMIADAIVDLVEELLRQRRVLKG